MGDIQKRFLASHRFPFFARRDIQPDLKQRFIKQLALIFAAVTLALSSLVVEMGVSDLTAIAASSSAIKVYDSLDASKRDFSGQSLVQLELNSADLEGANFKDADLRGAVFNGVNLHGANLNGANLSDAIMYVTDLTEADLTNANLSSTMLLMSRLKGATIDGADFSYATIDREQLFDLCKRASGSNPTTGADTKESLECP